MKNRIFCSMIYWSRCIKVTIKCFLVPTGTHINVHKMKENRTEGQKDNMVYDPSIWKHNLIHNVFN